MTPSIPDDGLTTENRVYNNTIRNADNGISVRNSDDNVFANNTFENIESRWKYILHKGSEITIDYQHFAYARISGTSGENTLTISNSGTIIVIDDYNTHNMDNDHYTRKPSGETVIIKSIK